MKVGNIFFIIFAANQNTIPMKQFRMFFYILLAGLFSSCETETLPAVTGYVFGSISTRVENSSTSLDANAEALFNASGGITLTNQIFKYNGTNWTSETNIPWTNPTSSTTLTALHPARNGQQFITDNPYSEEGLEDVLIAKTSFNTEKDIQLSFTHLFAMLTIHLQSPLKELVTDISLTSPKLDKINADGTFPLPSDTHTDTPALNVSGDYTFIIPPMEKCNLTLTLALEGIDSPVSYDFTHDFENGYKYECNVTNKEKPGIKTAEDLIEFSKIINMKKEGDLTKYGERQDDGRMLYRLLADIDFANVNNSQELLPIGYYDGPSVIFKDIFDGQGHTISNLTLPDKSINDKVEKGHSGIFGFIGESGVVKNLHISNAQTVESPICNNVGGIAAKSKGIIDNCSVQNSFFKAGHGGYIGGICGNMSNGCILNCHSTSNSFTAPENGYAGGIIGGTCGKILNSYAYDNQFNGVNNSYSGGISGSVYTVEKTNYLYISNTYVLHSRTYSNWGAFIGFIQSNNFSFDNTFYNGGTLVYDKETTYPGIYQYKYSQFQAEINGENKHVVEHLKKWIKTTGTNNYKDFVFNNWVKSDIYPYPAIFQ